MSTAISVIGLLAAAVIFVIAIWKGLDVFTSTILVSFIIILTSWMNWWDSLTLYATGYVGFIQNNVFVLVIGAVFGELMAASGCAESIANVITEKMGAKRVILSIALITTVFVYVGVSGFVVLFVLAPIATIMMKQAGYPYRMIPGIIFIGATCSAMIPFAINITNIMPAQYLGTSMGSAPILGWVAFLVSFGVGYFYMVHAAKKAAIKEGTAMDESQPVKITPTRDDLPNFFVALIPFILVVALVLLLSNLTDMNTNAVVVLSMFVGSVAIVLLCHKQVESVTKILEKGVNNGVGATVMAAAILGFSGVLQACPIQFNHRFCNGNQDESIYYRVYRIKRTCRYPRKWNISYCNVLRASFRWTSCKRSKCRSTSQTCTCMRNRYEYSSKCRRNGCTASLDEAFTCRELLVCIRYICSCSYGRFNRSSNCSNDSLLILNDLLFARQSCYYKAWRFFYTTDIFLYILL